jgi:hypothetical protein
LSGFSIALPSFRLDLRADDFDYFLGWANRTDASERPSADACVHNLAPVRNIDDREDEISAAYDAVPGNRCPTNSSSSSRSVVRLRDRIRIRSSFRRRPSTKGSAVAEAVAAAGRPIRIRDDNEKTALLVEESVADASTAVARTVSAYPAPANSRSSMDYNPNKANE